MEDSLLVLVGNCLRILDFELKFEIREDAWFCVSRYVVAYIREKKSGRDEWTRTISVGFSCRSFAGGVGKRV